MEVANLLYAVEPAAAPQLQPVGRRTCLPASRLPTIRAFQLMR
jgi:hypothetical protein